MSGAPEYGAPTLRHRAGLGELLPAIVFLGVYLAPRLFSPGFVATMRTTALVQLFL